MTMPTSDIKEFANPILPMNIEITYTPNDWLTYQKYLCKELARSNKTVIDSFWFNLILWMLLSLGFLTLFERLGEPHWPSFALALLFFFVLGAYATFQSLRLRNAFKPSEEGSFVGTHNFDFARHGISVQGKGYHSVHSWDIVHRVHRANGQIMIFHDTAAAFVFPEDRLENPDSFYAHLLELHGHDDRQAMK